MPVTLFCDTTLDYLTLGVRADTGEYAQYAMYTPKSSGILHSKIQDLLTETKQQASSINRVIVTRGPGSFTGVRVGLALAQAFAFANKADIVTIGTLQALALSVDIDKNTQTQGAAQSLCVVIPAGQGAVYRQGFSTDTARITQTSAEHVSLDTLALGNTGTHILVAPEHADIATYTPYFAGYSVMNHPQPQRIIDGAGTRKSEDITPLYVKPLSYKKVSA